MSNSHKSTARADAHPPGEVADYVDFDPIAVPASPASTKARLFLDTADGLLKWKYSDGTVRSIGTGLADPMTTRGDIIVRNAANATARLGVGSANKVLHSDGTDPSWQSVLPADLDVSADNTTADATTGHHGLLPKLGGGTTNFLRADGTWNAPAGGGGGLAQSYIGYNTAGATPGAFATDATTYYAKQVTLAGAVTLIGIGAYVDMHSGGGIVFQGVVYADASGSPGDIIGYCGSTANGQGGLYLGTLTDTPRWIDLPCAITLAAGTYWLAWGTGFQGTLYRIYHDASGSDGIITMGTSGFFEPVGHGATFASGSNKYSIRASILS